MKIIASRNSTLGLVSPDHRDDLDLSTLFISLRNTVVISLLAVFATLPIAQITHTSSASAANQYQDIDNRIKARNFARQAAEKFNGGLAKYRAELPMNSREAAPIVESPHFWIFIFHGGPPGNSIPTIESEVQVDKTSFSTTIVYNGPVRSAVNQNLLSTVNERRNAIILEFEERSRARSVARQAVEKTNGSANHYRVQTVRDQDVSKTVDKPDDWVFIFRGGPPGAATPTIESEVRVERADFKTTVTYNGPIRAAKQGSF
jgi:hypothetical protein